jgi:hypothetical protein
MMTVLDENLYWRIVADRLPTKEIIMHCTVKKWSHTIYKHLLGALCRIQQDLKEPLYAPCMNPKQEKFLLMMGFSSVEKFIYTVDGDWYQLFKFEVH